MKSKSQDKPHPLTKWREENRYTHVGFARLLASEFPTLAVTKQAVLAWEQRLARPTPDKIAAIEKLTSRKVRDKDFSNEKRTKARKSLAIDAPAILPG